MKAVKYTSKTGRGLYRPVLTIREAEHLMIDGDLSGFCLACGEDGRCEPDMERGHCESCGEPMLFGIEQLVLRGIAKIGNGKGAADGDDHQG